MCDGNKRTGCCLPEKVNKCGSLEKLIKGAVFMKAIVIGALAKKALHFKPPSSLLGCGTKFRNILQGVPVFS